MQAQSAYGKRWRLLESGGGKRDKADVEIAAGGGDTSGGESSANAVTPAKTLQFC